MTNEPERLYREDVSPVRVPYTFREILVRLSGAASLPTLGLAMVWIVVLSGMAYRREGVVDGLTERVKALEEENASLRSRHAPPSWTAPNWYPTAAELDARPADAEGCVVTSTGTFCNRSRPQACFTSPLHLEGVVVNSGSDGGTVISCGGGK